MAKNKNTSVSSFQPGNAHLLIVLLILYQYVSLQINLDYVEFSTSAFHASAVTIVSIAVGRVDDSRPTVMIS